MRWLWVVLLFLVACSDNERIPSDVIDRPKMEKVLWEMMLADRFSNAFILSRKDTLGRNIKESLQVYDKVLDYNKLSRKEFYHSYNFYLGRPDLLKVMFDSIFARADRNRAKVFEHRGIDSVKWRLDSAHNMRRRDSLRSRVDSVRSRGLTGASLRTSDSLARLRMRDSLRRRAGILGGAAAHKVSDTSRVRAGGKRDSVGHGPPGGAALHVRMDSLRRTRPPAATTR